MTFGVWRRAVLRAGAATAIVLLAACGDDDAAKPLPAPTVAPAAAPAPTPTPAAPITAVNSTPVTSFAAPWAMVFLPDGRLLVTERDTTNNAGRLWLTTTTGEKTAVTGLPANIGLLDVALHPQFAGNGIVYISYVEPGDASTPRVGRAADVTTLSPAGLAVATGRLMVDATGVSLSSVRTIWRQAPKIVAYPGSGEFGGRMVFSPNGQFLFVAAGDRQEFDPVQQFDNTIGKIVRLLPDGTVPGDNPFVGRAGAAPEIWTLGHRNPYGLSFDAAGQLWSHEQGPKGGDEFNLIAPGGNYGWPRVSNGDNYDDTVIPDHAPGDGFVAPAKSWTPVIAPAGMIFYMGTMFAAWRGDAIVTGLQSGGLVRVRVSGSSAAEEQRLSLGARTREVEQGPDGALWVLEDKPGRLLRLTPAG
ncbi:PQQ-dependent sugar dehydrogenase [Sphingomonas sp. Leaf343]|uniref:PQQ-dependent sugar dehydrogenase n=1 Tax=Sphingomonas sp. Leaf343 TaxID=1736345 RepID=UPI0009E6FF46|nr:PQQ-dependent sugar dehydrogenase [Sphingomonas sp. Leaf343]